MTDFLTGAELAAYLERDESAAIDNIVSRTNALVTEEWSNPVDPAPEWVKNIAWDVAIRAAGNPTPGKTSTTRSWDDVTVTDRWESGQRGGVYLTDEEKALLLGDGAEATAVAAASIAMKVPGWSRPQDYPCY